MGRIAAYEQATLGVISLSAELSDLQAQVDDNVPTTEEFVSDNIAAEATASESEIADAIEGLDPTSESYSDDLAAIAADLTGLDPTDPDNVGAIDALAADIDATVTAQAEQEALAAEIAAVEAELADQQSEQISALASAYSPNNISNLSQESLATLNGRLGLDPGATPDVSTVSQASTVYSR